VCDNAAGETCPVWLGKPTTAHWGIPDPSAVEGTDIQKKAAFAQASKLMSTPINLFLSLPLWSIDQLRIKQEMDSIGKTPVGEAPT
jgi:arsenate reductase